MTIKIITLSLVLASSLFAGGDIDVIDIPVIKVPQLPPIVESNNFYVGLGLSGMNFFNDNTDETLKSLAVTLQAGYVYNEYIGVELRYSKSVGDVAYDKGNTAFANVSNYPTDSQNIALYLRPSYPLGDFTLYGLIGYGMLKYTDLPTGTNDKTESGFQWGLGAEYLITDSISTFIDYTSLYNDVGFDGHIPNSDVRTSMGTVGLAYHF